MIYRGTMRPIYIQIRDILVEDIESGKLSPGDSIPSERNLAEIYNVSRVTIRKCISIMVDEGYLTKSRGKPPVVATPEARHPLKNLLGVAEEFASTDKNIKVKLLSKGYTKITKEVKENLQSKEGKEMYEFSRLILKNDIPLVLNYSYVSSEIGKLVETLDLRSDKVFAYFENCGYKMTHAQQEISADLCEQPEADLLDYKVGSPIIKVHRVTYLDSGDPILYEISHYRDDLYKYNIKLLRNKRR